MKQPVKVCYADTETTGFAPYKNEIVQIAAIIEIDDVVVDTFEMKLAPARKEYISKEALLVTKKTEREILAYPNRIMQFKHFIERLDKHVDPYDSADKMIIGGQNVPFDRRMLAAMFMECGSQWFSAYFDRTDLDLMQLVALMQRAGHVPMLKNRKLGTIAAHYGFEFDAHDALEDIRVTRKLILKMLSFIKPAPGQAELPLVKQAANLIAKEVIKKVVKSYAKKMFKSKKKKKKKKKKKS
ncbi:MAG: 3'-5' exonuclease [Nitrososphaerales archaeon]